MSLRLRHRASPRLRWLSLVSLLLLVANIRSSNASTTKDVFRKNNLDYFNVETLDYFLSLDANANHQTTSTLDYDVAVLFYANWDRNSHVIAPMWGQIAHLLQAGTVDSQLVMGLFDCELDAQTSQLCNKAGITHYPTVMFLNTQTLQPLQRQFPKHATKFQGNWQYGDAMLDWVKSLKYLSKWHQQGVGKRLRSFLWNILTGQAKHKTKEELPLGIPTASTTTGGGGASSSTSATLSAENKMKMDELQKEVTDMKDLAVRTGVMVEAMLFPHTSKDHGEELIAATLTHDPNNVNKTFTDMFQLINRLEDGNGWTAKADSASLDTQILRTCVQDISLDYCQRFAEVLAESVIHDLLPDSYETSTAQEQDETLTNIQVEMMRRLRAEEPYCGVLEECIISEFSASPDCRPAGCPFQDTIACRYVTTCLSENMQNDYAKAMGIDDYIVNKRKEKEETKAGQAAAKPAGEGAQPTQEDTDGAKQKKGGMWGLGG